MERKIQNSDFSKKLDAKSDECLKSRSQRNFELTRPKCASGGDIGANYEIVHYNSKNPSCQSISLKTNLSDDRFDDAEPRETAALLRKIPSDLSNALDIKQHLKLRSKLGEAESCKLRAELSKYKKELNEYNNTTKDLEEKYMKINNELSEMQQKHDLFVANRKSICNNETETCSDSSSSTGSEYALKRKYTQVFHRGSSYMTMLPTDVVSSTENLESTYTQSCTAVPPVVESSATRRKRKPHSHVAHAEGCPAGVKRPVKRKPENKENTPPNEPRHGHASNPATDLKDIYKVLKNVLETNPKAGPNSVTYPDLKELQTTVANLQNEKAQFRNIIQQQQNCLNDYHTRCVKAQKIMQTQQQEIAKLSSNNHKLETEITSGIDQLRNKVDSKLRDVSHLPHVVREEQIKCEKVTKENCIMMERLRILQHEAAQLKMKMEDLSRRKVLTINRLKATERDLKIFKNYNMALKHEKRKLCDELQKMKEQLEAVQSTSKRALTRQREQNEKQRRDLQKRVFELELKLSRSQTSTTNLIQERDSLIAELQTQLNTLVHNFEVSQKHIRVLRRHIYSMSGRNIRSNTQIPNEAV